MKRVFLIVLDSVGIGEMPDADKYGDVGSNTLKACSKSTKFNIPTLKQMGLGNIDGVDFLDKFENPIASFGKMAELSKDKDTTVGHWEIAGLHSEKKFPTFPNGFPKSIIQKFEDITGKRVLCNKPYSGTEVLENFGKECVDTDSIIVYTSADSVFQVAAHEDIVPLETLYEYCRKVRKILVDDFMVGRVIARPFIGKYPNFVRTKNRKDFSVEPPDITMLDQIKEKNLDVIAIGKISDIFANRGVTQKIKTSDNLDGMHKTYELLEKNFEGLCFVNLVDFDMLYGHRNDIDGYANALSQFDRWLSNFILKLRDDDILIITADHGCDPSTPSTDHSREYTPMIIFGNKIKQGVNLKIRDTFADIGATILEYLQIGKKIEGTSFLSEVLK